MFSSGIGIGEGPKAFSARRKRQMESLPAGEQQTGPLEFSRDFAHHVDGFRFKVLEVIEMITAERSGL